MKKLLIATYAALVLSVSASIAFDSQDRVSFETPSLIQNQTEQVKEEFKTEETKPVPVVKTENPTVTATKTIPSWKEIGRKFVDTLIEIIPTLVEILAELVKDKPAK